MQIQKVLYHSMHVCATNICSYLNRQMRVLHAFVDPLICILAVHSNDHSHSQDPLQISVRDANFAEKFLHREYMFVLLSCHR